MDVSDGITKVLEAVPKVAFYGDHRSRCPEDVPFPSCMRALLEFLPDEGWGCKHTARTSRITPCTYAAMMAVSGAAWHHSWGEGWSDDNCAIWYMSDDALAPFARAFQATGYGHTYLPSSERSSFRAAIVDSIDRGRPVIAMGVVGPPDACLIAGYADGGETAIGWSPFQSSPEFSQGLTFAPNGMFQQRGWEEACAGLHLVGERGERPPAKETLHQTVAWATEIALRGEVTAYGGKRWNGLAAYDTWAEHLLRDDDFAVANSEELGHRFDVHDMVVGTIAEGRWYGSVYLAGAAEADWPIAQPLLHAAACYAQEHTLMWQAWDAVGGIGRSPEKVKRFADPAVRRTLAEIIRQARAKESEAVEYLAAAMP